MKFYTADEHWFHGRIIKYCNRPFDNLKHMHLELQKRHNSVVGDEDEVWHIGDASMLSPEFSGRVEKIMRQLNGRHHLVLGNHDRFKPFNYIKIGFDTVHTAMWFECEGYRFVLAHDPAIYVALDDRTILLHGHVHNMWKHLLNANPSQKIINVGVDVWNYYPASETQILNLLKENGVEP